MDKEILTVITLPKIIDDDIYQLLRENPRLAYCVPIFAGEYYGPNANIDYFPEKELIGDHYSYGYASFIGKPFITYHGKGGVDILGTIVWARYNHNIKAVETLIEITDDNTYNFIQETGILPVSMGCKVAYDQCSYCGNKAKFRFQYCDHIKEALSDVKNRIMTKYYLINVRPKFVEISKVSVPADPRAYAYNLQKISELLEKSANFKIASSMSDKLDVQSSMIFQNAKYKIISDIMHMLDKQLPMPEIKKYLSDLGISDTLIEKIMIEIKKLLNLMG